VSKGEFPTLPGGFGEKGSTPYVPGGGGAVLICINIHFFQKNGKKKAFFA
jgi:hypothetical protein